MVAIGWRRETVSVLYVSMMIVAGRACDSMVSICSSGYSSNITASYLLVVYYHIPSVSFSFFCRMGLHGSQWIGLYPCLGRRTIIHVPDYYGKSSTCIIPVYRRNTYLSAR